MLYYTQWKNSNFQLNGNQRLSKSKMSQLLNNFLMNGFKAQIFDRSCQYREFDWKNLNVSEVLSFKTWLK
jgi:hypothetical protein